MPLPGVGSPGDTENTSTLISFLKPFNANSAQAIFLSKLSLLVNTVFFFCFIAAGITPTKGQRKAEQ